MYESVKLKRHGKGVMTYFDRALADFNGEKEDLSKLGNRHFNRGIAIPHYEVVG